MKRVVVTGSNGFTGRYVVSELQRRGYKVFELVRSKKKSTHIVCDLTSKKSLKLVLDKVKPNYIVHLAALSFVAHDDVNELYDINLFCTLNILEACDELGLDLFKVIISSSANVYGAPAVDKISESQPAAPVNHYAISKLAMEHVCKLWFEKFPILITRPFNYTGIGQNDRFLVPKIVGHFKRRDKEIELGNLDVYRDFSDVRDVSVYYCDLLESSAYSDVVNLCSGSVSSLSFIIEEMERIAGYEILVKVNPNFVRDNEIRILGGDRNKLSKLIGREPIFSLEKTLIDMYYEDNC